MGFNVNKMGFNGWYLFWLNVDLNHSPEYEINLRPGNDSTNPIPIIPVTSRRDDSADPIDVKYVLTHYGHYSSGWR